MSSPLDKYRGEKRRGGRVVVCPKCGRSSGGAVVVQLREAGPGKTQTLASRSRTYCEEHALEAFERTLAAIDRSEQ